MEWVKTGVYQQGTSPGQLEWDCGDETILVTAIKFPHGTSFRLTSSNKRTMVTKPETFNSSEATAHLCGHTVANPDTVSSAVHKLIREWGEFCGTVPQLCDKNYDLQNKRRTVGSVRG